MRILEEKYPKGTILGQHEDGRYMDDNLYENLKILADKIADDMQFMGLVCSSTFEVRTGKSTLMQQIGEAWTDLVNKAHGTNLTFDMKNVVFNSTEFIKRAFELPKYSILILDENDEIDEHYWSDLSKNLRRFFRKSGQLNLFTLLCVPNFFQLKASYAIGRSIFLIDVKFKPGFERGLFAFFSYNRKKELFIKGKKEQNYRVVPPDFQGGFRKGYAVDRDEYLAAKLKDLEAMELEEESSAAKKRRLLAVRIKKMLPQLTLKEMAHIFDVDDTTISEWYQLEKDTGEAGMRN